MCTATPLFVRYKTMNKSYLRYIILIGIITFLEWKIVTGYNLVKIEEDKNSDSKAIKLLGSPFFHQIFFVSIRHIPKSPWFPL
jgi:hypothetical protein